MNQPTTLICLAFLGAIFGTINGVIAHYKGRHVVGWAVLGAGSGLLCGIFGFIPLIIVACLPNLNEQKARDSYQAEENRRLREQLRQERIKSESFRQHATSRLDAHDKHLGLDTRSAGPELAGAENAGQLSAGNPYELSDPAAANGPRWYYGRQGQTYGPIQATEITDLIRSQVITRDTLLWSDDMADWTPARDVAVFSGQFTQ